MKTKKITSGYYQGIYNGIEFTICKVESNESIWYWQIGNRSVEDQYSSKKVAILAAIDWIESNSNNER